MKGVGRVLVTTTDLKVEYEVLGLAVGASTRARHLGLDILASLRKLVGGEVKEYSALLAEARDVAIAGMIERAEEMGANAIVGMRLGSSTITTGVAEIIAYGTAVRI